MVYSIGREFSRRYLFYSKMYKTSSLVRYCIPWACALGVYMTVPSYIPLGQQVLVMILFALSLDLILGYGGIITLGHAAFYGLGAYTAGLLATYGPAQPLIGLLLGTAVSALAGALVSLVFLRTRGLALVMLTMCFALLLLELTNRFAAVTGGFDGLAGYKILPLLGLFEFDLSGKVAYLYCLAVLFVAATALRFIVDGPFGQSLIGIKMNEKRMAAIGTPVRKRLGTAFSISAGIAGAAGALTAQTTGFVGLDVFSFNLSGTVLVMLILGGAGKFYGAFIGVPVYMLFQYTFSNVDPVYWLFWIGLGLILIVISGKDGLFDIGTETYERTKQLWSHRSGRYKIESTE